MDPGPPPRRRRFGANPGTPSEPGGGGIPGEHRATNREGFPPGTSNPREVQCRDKAVLIARSFEMAPVVPGAVAGCLEFPDRVVYSALCGTAVTDISFTGLYGQRSSPLFFATVLILPLHQCSGATSANS